MCWRWWSRPPCAADATAPPAARGEAAGGHAKPVTWRPEAGARAPAAPSVHASGGGGLARRLQQHLRGVDRVEAVLRATEVAAHLHLALLGDDRFDLLAPQRLEHAADPLARAGTGKARALGAGQRLEAAQVLFPEQAVQDGLGVQRQQFLALEAGGQDGDAVVVLVAADLVFVARQGALARQVGLSLQRQALDQQARGDLVVRRQHQAGVQLLALQHVVFDDLAELFQLLATVADQRHHALVGLLAGQSVLGVERDGTASAVEHIDHVRQRRVVGHRPLHVGGGAQAQVGLHLGHGQLDRAVALDLQDQRAVELDVGLHQRGRSGHFAQQVGHRGRVAARLLATAQDFLPAVGQAHQHAAHRQAFKQEFVEFGQSVLSSHQTTADRAQPIFFKPRRKRSALAR